MNKFGRFLLPIIVFAMLLGACAPAATPAPTQPAPAAQPTQALAAQPTNAPVAAPAGGAPVKIEFWTLLTGSLGDQLNTMINEYNASQNKVQIVNVNQGSYEALQAKLLAAVAAGAPPAVLMTDYKYVPFYAQKGIFEPIDNLASKQDMADFIPGLLVDLTYQGKVYAVPFNRSTQVLYYNKDMFKAAGLDPEKPPTTWDEFRTVACKLTDASKGQFGAYAGGNMGWFFEPFVYQAGGQVSDADSNWTFQDDKGVQAAKYLQDLANKDKCTVVPANLTGTFDQRDMEFLTGKVAMMRDSTALQSTVATSAKFNWGLASLPAGPGGSAITTGGGNIAITAKSSPEQKAAAWDFVRFLTGTQKSAQWFMATGYMPTRQSVMALPEVQAFEKTHPSYQVAVQELTKIHPTAVGILNAPEWTTVIPAALDRIIINNEDPATVLKQAAADMQKTIDAARAAGTLIKTQ
jgi:sn-glycerol 3-phosphate transport system substrate-binding protein